tara:strand:+ start:86 stop:277 length:192 start_codon:yes stop_codon:yes gene_type:complete
MKKIYKNWFVHNVFGHSISELLYWVIMPFDAKRASIVSMWVHDATRPNKEHKDETYVNIKKLK